jgi:hypothetical protein
MLILQLITTFHQVVSDKTGNDVSIGRAKTMVALASITWPAVNIVVTPFFITPERVMWKSPDFDSLSLIASFRRDPIGEDAAIVIEEIEPDQITMIDEMRECVKIIPLYGRQRLDRFNLALARLFSFKASNNPLPLPGGEPDEFAHCKTEFRQLREWLVDHNIITAEGLWISLEG